MSLLRYLPPRLLRHRLHYLSLFLSVLILLPIFQHLLLSLLPIYYTTPIPLLLARNVLLVTAHPDDESLFFAPTITALTRLGPPTRLALLVLSSGNHYDRGAERRVEQAGACETLGIWDQEHCMVLDRTGLKDDPKVFWEHDVVMEAVTEYVEKWKIDAIITFDSGGASGHRNHISVSDAIVSTAQSQPSFPPTYTLTTTNLLRKYSFLFDLPLTSLLYTWRASLSYLSNYRSPEPALFVSSLSRWIQGVRGFQRHVTQNTWDRHLYVVLARGMWVNDLRLVGAKA